LQNIGEQKKLKQDLLLELEQLDNMAEEMASPADIWKQRYELEAKLEQIYTQEELFWQQRGDTRWIREGDSNTDFFHQFANGRRRKKTIVFLETKAAKG
jgi:hypothetical protein